MINSNREVISEVFKHPNSGYIVFDDSDIILASSQFISDSKFFLKINQIISYFLSYMTIRTFYSFPIQTRLLPYEVKVLWLLNNFNLILIFHLIPFEIFFINFNLFFFFAFLAKIAKCRD